MSFAGPATFATIEEAWGSGVSLGASVPPNVYQDPAYQRQVLETSGNYGIISREPQDLDAGVIKEYLTKLYAQSGPMAVKALLPAGFLQRQCLARQRFHALEDEPDNHWDMLVRILQDQETLLLLLLASFAVLVMSD